MILLVRLLFGLLTDVGRFTSLLFKPRQAIPAENLICAARKYCKREPAGKKAYGIGR
jgi:hypothetical protein